MNAINGFDISEVIFSILADRAWRNRPIKVELNIDGIIIKIKKRTVTVSRKGTTVNCSFAIFAKNHRSIIRKIEDDCK